MKRAAKGKGQRFSNRKTGVLLFRLLALVLGTLLGLGLGEGAAAIALHYLEQPLPAVSPTFEPIPVQVHPYLQLQIRPNVQGSVIRTNSFGLRNRELQKEREGGRFRILLLGGSVAWGNSAANNESTIAEFLESRLNRRFRNSPASFEVLNGAVPGYVTWQAALSYALKHRYLQPDLVISIDGVNDVDSAIQNGQSGLPVNFRPYFSEREMKGRLSEWLQFRLSRSKISRLGRKLYPSGFQSYSADSSEQVGKAYRNAMDYLGQLVRKDGGKLLVVLQPTSLLQDSKKLTTSERIGTQAYLSKIPGVETYFRDCFAEIRERMRELEETQTTTNFLDATEIFAGISEPTFVDYCHLTLLGRSLVARELEKQVVMLLMNRRLVEGTL